MRPDSITLSIEEHYTPEEKKEIADQLAMAISDLDTIRGEKKVSDAAFNERIKSKEAAIEDLAKRYNKGCEVAKIGCDIKYDTPEAGKKSYIRFDNAEVVEVHDMSWEEKQETIQFPLTEATAAEQPATEATSESADELTKMLGDVTPCEHPSVSNVDGVWKCDACKEPLDAPLGTEENPYDFNQDKPDDSADAASA